MAFWLPAIVMATGIMAVIQYGINALLPFVFLLLFLAGSIIGVLLLWYELDQYNPVLQQICSAGKKVNCSAILQSKAAKIGGISWSTIGFSYFMGGLLLLLLWGITNPLMLFTLAWLNVFAIPYVFYSVYYQLRIAKQWCVLCLFVQGLLVLQLIVATVARWHTLWPLNLITAPLLIQLVIIFSIPYMVVNILFPALLKAKERNRINNELQKLKHNLQIFDALIAKQKIITTPTESLGITIGNPNAKHHLAKVCSPYCSPCSKAHLLIDELLENNPDIRLQIIFNAFDNDQDINTPPIKHLLAISENGSEQTIKQALDAWYLADKKDYGTFAAVYPMNGELKQQTDKIKAMREWCDKTDITFTPTFFIDGYQLPDIYTVTDLKYFLSV